MDYAAFLDTKRVVAEPAGFDPPADPSPHLFGFQRKIVDWATRRGRAAIFADCGTGKSICELQWATNVHRHTGRDVLLLTPLAVARQMGREADKFGFSVTVCRTAAEARPGINVTNYERLHHFRPDSYSGIVIDESSVLKALDSKTRKGLSDFAKSIPYRLAATATPAPNEIIELQNHAEFLDVMSQKEMLATFFVQDGNSTQKWRLKGHAEEAFWRWLASWAVAVRKPSDLGFPDDGYDLPPLTIEEVVVDSAPLGGYLFAMEASGLAEQREARKSSLEDRVAAAARIVNESEGPFLVWCDLNAESEALRRAIPGSVEVRGSDDPDSKERNLMAFVDGAARVLVSKPSIFGHGLNLQHCNQMAFVGLSNSYEQVYQAVRRCWRFGQTRPVTCWFVISEAEGAVRANIERKERQAAEMFDSIVRHMKGGLSEGRSVRDEMNYRPSQPMMIPQWLSRGA